MSAHEKEDLFSHLLLNVSDEGFDIYDGLGRYFDDIVEFNGVKKRMEVTLVDLPPLLQIQLQVSIHARLIVAITHSISSERNSIARHNRLISLRRMSSFGRRSIWTGSWIAPTTRRRLTQRIFSRALAWCVTAYSG